MDEEQEKRDLIQQMGSADNATALAAVEKLRERGWLSDGSLRRADLSKAQLRGADLSDVDMSDADLSDADLTSTDLSGAKLIGVNLVGASLSRAMLNDADLSGANLIGTNLYDAYLSRVNFSNVLCFGTTFADVNLSTAKGLGTVEHGGPSEIGIQTIFKSKGKIPEEFLRGCGVPDDLITYLPSLMGEAIAFYSCFISYSSQDQAFTDQLAGRMRDNKLRVWYAPENMKGGAKIYEQLDAAIKLHDKLMIVLSSHSMNSPWVQTEIRNAVTRERRENRRVLFPIRLCTYEDLEEWELWDSDMVLDLAREIREYFIPDFSNWKDYDSFSAAFERLLADLQKSED